MQHVQYVIAEESAIITRGQGHVAVANYRVLPIDWSVILAEKYYFHINNLIFFSSSKPFYHGFLLQSKYCGVSDTNELLS